MNQPGGHISEIGGYAILFVMATEQEYGEHLKQRITPLITGVGPVEAAAAVSAALAFLSSTQSLPDLVFTLGSAGSRTLDHAAIYQIASVSYRDIDASVLGIPKGVTPFLGAPAVIPIAQRIEGIPAASLSTGGAVISGAGYDAIADDMVDMESFAIFRAAQRFGVPMIGLRGISDGRAPLNRLSDWTEYLAVIDRKLALAVDDFTAQIAGRPLHGVRSSASRSSSGA